MIDAASANNSPLVSRNRAHAKIAASLNLFVGRGRRYSVKQLSNATGVKDRTIECAKLDPENPDWRPLPTEALLSLSLFLGPTFTNEFLVLAGQAAFELPDGEPSPGDLAADSAEDSAAVVRAAVDGRFDPDERKDLRLVGTRMMSNGAQLIALDPRREAPPVDKAA